VKTNSAQFPESYSVSSFFYSPLYPQASANECADLVLSSMTTTRNWLRYFNWKTGINLLGSLKV